MSGEEEAVKLMNDNRYGLTAGVYTKDKATAMRILSRVNAGTAYWNCCDRVAVGLPWSGKSLILLTTLPIMQTMNICPAIKAAICLDWVSLYP